MVVSHAHSFCREVTAERASGEWPDLGIACVFQGFSVLCRRQAGFFPEHAGEVGVVVISEAEGDFLGRKRGVGELPFRAEDNLAADEAPGAFAGYGPHGLVEVDGGKV